MEGCVQRMPVMDENVFATSRKLKPVPLTEQGRALPTEIYLGSNNRSETSLIMLWPVFDFVRNF